LHYPFLDFGNGRITLGLETLGRAEWLEIVDHADELGGHALLEKAPDEFRHQNDVFGRPRSEWGVIHRVKHVLDPNNIFSPGLLPGKV
jgi:D-lactate dehydrogenase (cytochrome)/glycolate oxidase